MILLLYALVGYLLCGIIISWAAGNFDDRFNKRK